MPQTASVLPHEPADTDGTGSRVSDRLLDPQVLRWELAIFIAVSLVLTRTSANFADYVKSISSFLFP
jgi:hypothetical protein